MQTVQASSAAHYIRYACCLALSTVLAAPVGFHGLAYFSGAFIRLESVSAKGLWLGVGSAACVAGLAFWLLMNIGKRVPCTILWKVGGTVAISALVLALLGQVAARSAVLTDYMAAAVWLALMLTVGFLPFAPQRTRA